MTYRDNAYAVVCKKNKTIDFSWIYATNSSHTEKEHIFRGDTGEGNEV